MQWQTTGSGQWRVMARLSGIAWWWFRSHFLVGDRWNSCGNDYFYDHHNYHWGTWAMVPTIVKKRFCRLSIMASGMPWPLEYHCVLGALGIHSSGKKGPRYYSYSVRESRLSSWDLLSVTLLVSGKTINIQFFGVRSFVDDDSENRQPWYLRFNVNLRSKEILYL